MLRSPIESFMRVLEIRTCHRFLAGSKAATLEGAY
jgi:hypothetical protein